MTDLDAELANFEAELASLAAATETVENVSRLEMKFIDGFCVGGVVSANREASTSVLHEETNLRVTQAVTRFVGLFMRRMSLYLSPRAAAPALEVGPAPLLQGWRCLPRLSPRHPSRRPRCRAAPPRWQHLPRGRSSRPRRPRQPRPSRHHPRQGQRTPSPQRRRRQSERPPPE